MYCKKYDETVKNNVETDEIAASYDSVTMITCDISIRMISPGSPISIHLATWPEIKHYHIIQIIFSKYLFTEEDDLHRESLTRTGQNQLVQPAEQRKEDLRTWT